MLTTTFGYLDSEDRVWLSLGDEARRVWLTRRITAHLLVGMARQLETECEGKLSVYARMTSSASSASASSGGGSGSHSSGPPSTEATEREIEDLLRRARSTAAWMESGRQC